MSACEDASVQESLIERLSQNLKSTSLDNELQHDDEEKLNTHRQQSTASHPRSIVYTGSVWTQSQADSESIVEQFEQRVSNRHSQIASLIVRAHVVTIEWLYELLEASPYLAPLHLLLAETFRSLRYPDLAAGAAYKALLLLDAIADDSDEYHEQAREVYEEGRACWEGGDHQAAGPYARLVDLQTQRQRVYHLLADSLLRCGNLKSAYFYCTKGLELDHASVDLQHILQQARKAAFVHLGESQKYENPLTWPDTGLVRREKYPWNTYEPDRLNDLDVLNTMMNAVAPKLEVRATRLPALSHTSKDGQAAEVVQLGVFAKEDLLPGEIVLKEISLLTANNKLQDALCDACSVELPGLHSTESAEIVACEDCQVVFCSQTCYDMAQQSYHPALCEKEVESIAKDVPPSEASDSLYALLLLRTFAMVETQDCHPLELQEVKYIWGDFNDIEYSLLLAEDTADDLPRKSLPFSFEYNITLPLHMLEKMDVDIFANTRYDTWIFNTLYAKFRGTASARLSGLGGRAMRGPEVAAVHPMWCLANHSCDPSVSWEWSAEIRFRVREERAEWQGKDKNFRSAPGVKKGDEVLNHYCDLNLPVQERREWARGALGGDCMCDRCIWESQQTQAVNAHMIAA